MPTIQERPAGIECLDWRPRESGKKRCAFYLPPDAARGEVGALCNLATRFLCEEWERANAGLVPAARLAAVQKADPALSARTSSSGPKTPEPPPPPAEPPAQRDGAQLALLGQPATPPPPPPRPPEPAVTTSFFAPPPAAPYRPAKDIPREDVRALEEMGVELLLEAKGLRPVWLVPRKTGRTDRFEMTFREAATLRLIVDAFPGSRVTAIQEATEHHLADG